MITIPSMPTQFRPLPELEIELDIPQLRTLANALGEIVVENRWKAGLCIEVAKKANNAHIDSIFSQAVGHGMNRGVNNHRYAYIYQFLDEIDVVELEELTAIRQAWAKHIARAIYEQIGE